MIFQSLTVAVKQLDTGDIPPWKLSNVC